MRAGSRCGISRTMVLYWMADPVFATAAPAIEGLPLARKHSTRSPMMWLDPEPCLTRLQRVRRVRLADAQQSDAN
jgi:hypothetical protein